MPPSELSHFLTLHSQLVFLLFTLNSQFYGLLHDTMGSQLKNQDQYTGFLDLYLQIYSCYGSG